MTSCMWLVYIVTDMDNMVNVTNNVLVTEYSDCMGTVPAMEVQGVVMVRMQDSLFVETCQYK